MRFGLTTFGCTRRIFDDLCAMATELLDTFESAGRLALDRLRWSPEDTTDAATLRFPVDRETLGT